MPKMIAIGVDSRVLETANLSVIRQLLKSNFSPHGLGEVIIIKLTRIKLTRIPEKLLEVCV